MKRLLLALSLLTLTVSSSFGQCPSPEIAPWTETFTTTVNPPCWTQSTTTGGPWVYTGSPDLGNTSTIVDHTSGVSNNYAWVDQSSTDVGVILTGPEVDVTALTTPAVSVWVLSHNNSGTVSTYNSIFVEASDGVGGWSVVSEITGDFGFQWQEFTFDISAYTYGANLVQIRFRAESGGDTYDYDNDMLIDDVSVLEAPSCFTPSSLAANNIFWNSADLSWQENGSATTWNIEYGPTGFTQGTGTPLNGVTNNPESITGLTGSTGYDFYVQADCGGGDLSAWAGPFNFTTACAPVVAPWTDDLETLTPTTTFTADGCWDATSVSAYDWNVDGAGSTPTTTTGPSGANSGVNYFYVEASSGTAGDIATLTSPLIDISALTLPMVEFYYHMYGSTMGNLYVDAWDGSAWNQVGSILGQQQSAETDPWLRKVIYLSGYTGTTQLRFRAESAGTLYGDISIDDISVLEAPSCPEPMDFMLTASDLTSGDFSWNPVGSETEWQLEFGAPGFTPDVQAGTSILTSNNPETVSGLTSNSFYDIYLQAVCSPGDTSMLVGPITFNTYNQGMYMDWDTQCGPGFTDISGTGVLNTLGDDGEVGVALPFSLLYQGTLYTDATIGSNGAIVFGSQSLQVGFSNGALSAAADGLYPFWDDLGPEEAAQGEGVFYETIGTAPNQQFIVQWNKDRLGGDGTFIFQIIIDEATQEIYHLYDVVAVGESSYDYGLSATVGVAGPNQDIQQSLNDTQFLMDHSCSHFYYTNCPNPTNYTVIYTTNDEAGISWSAGLAGETNWTVIYGVTGFDPTSAGTTITTTVGSAILTGLDDITTYDVYIYADCNPGTLQSNGFMGQFTTTPNCSDPTGLAVTSATDSLFSSWSWVESSGAGLYPSSGFNVQYGMTGFDLYTGSITNADNNYTDTTFDASLLAGGVYDVYVQAVCGTDTSNYVGPFTVVMPIDNDTTCFAENLNVDGTVYYFNNSGASVQTGEAAIAPPATGCEMTDGWCNTSVNFTTWFTFQAPASGNILISGMDQNFNGQVAVYETTDCSDFNTFTLLGANDDNVVTGANGPEFIMCGLTPGNTYYLMHDSWSTVTTGQYSLRLEEITVNAGTSSGIIDACTGETVNLFDNMTGYDDYGVWTEWIATVGLTDSMFNTSGLAYSTFNFAYTVTQGCAVDSVQQQIHIFGPSSAGNDGTLDVCKNQPYDLVSGLSGNVDLGGTWYDPANNALASSALTAPNLPGQFNFDYITSNGVCPSDTSNVVVNVLATCDWLSVEELYFSGVEVYPNPATQNVFISNLGSDEVFNYELTDAQGKVIATKENAINGTKITEIDVRNLEVGLYMIRVYNENAEKTFRIVKQ